MNEFPRATRLLLLAVLPAAMATARAEEPEPSVQRTVLEDDRVRIEELRVRGQVQRVVVRNKNSNLKDYEVLTGDAGRDPSQRGRAAGQRVWHILSF
jgi:hypothetical protein